jgi:uncharacterized delta-60 repeat protein
MTRVAAFLSLLLIACALAAYGAAGSLDSTFGKGGMVQTSFGIPVIPSTVLLQPNGSQPPKIVVVAGFDNTSTATESFGVVRYTANGVLDTGFGTQGMSLADFTNFINSPNGAAMQPDGKIIVVGEAQSADGTLHEFAIARFNANGGLDASFGNGGKVTTNFVGVQPGGVSNPATLVLLQADGRILVIGDASQCAKCVHYTAWARYNPNGTLDPSFASGGTQLTTIYGGTPNAIVEISNGDLQTIAGSVKAQFSSIGVLRAAVTSGTIVAASVGGANVPQQDGKFLLAQRFGEAGFRDSDVQVIRFGGGVDWAFVSAPFDFGFESATADVANAIVLQPDTGAGQKIIVAGSSSPSSTSQNFGLAELNPDGSLDSSFGVGGKVTTTFTGANAFIKGLVLQPDGKIVAMGAAYSNGSYNLVLARYLVQ